MNYEDIGRRVKAAYPKVYDHFSDEEIGRRYHTKYLAGAGSPTPPTFFPGTQTKHVKKQTEYLEAAEAQQSFVRSSSFNRLFELQRLEEEQVMKDHHHELALETAEASNIIIHEAQKRQVDAPTYQQMRLVEHAADVEVKKQKRIKTHETACAAALERAKEKTRIRGYRDEVQIDLTATLAAGTAAHHSLAQIETLIEKTKREYWQIKNDPRIFNEEMREDLLNGKRTLIKGLEDSRNVQIQRLLLEAPDEKELEGTDPQANSQTID